MPEGFYLRCHIAGCGWEVPAGEDEILAALHAHWAAQHAEDGSPDPRMQDWILNTYERAVQVLARRSGRPPALATPTSMPAPRWPSLPPADPLITVEAL